MDCQARLEEEVVLLVVGEDGGFVFLCERVCLRGCVRVHVCMYVCKCVCILLNCKNTEHVLQWTFILNESAQPHK